MSRRHEVQDATGVITRLANVGVLELCGTGAPTNGQAGFAPGCVYIRVDGSAGTTRYVNEGTSSSTTWVAEITAGGTNTLSAATITTLTETNLTGAAASTPASVSGATGTAQTIAVTMTGGVGGTSTNVSGTGGVGAGYSFTGGAGGLTTGTTAPTGGAGGAWAVTTGAGGATTTAASGNSTGGASGAITSVTGTGGAVSGAVAGTATGGASGAVSYGSGTGGAVTATTGTNVGGASGAVSFVSGTGGAASGATDTGGASGAVTIGSGDGGAGDTGGASGNTVIKTGAAGAGGSPAVGVISFTPGNTTERWRMTTAGALASAAATPTNTNLLGVITAVGYSVTDATASIISASTHGAGSTATLIGNATITVSSDIRVKKDVVTWSGKALDAIERAPRVVEFTYDIPGCGGDLAAEGDEDARKYGPNARGRYLGFIAQETVEWAPWVVNAGAGKECPKCRKGHTCKDHPTPWTVEYEHLVPMLIKAVQELSAKVKRLEAVHG